MPRARHGPLVLVACTLSASPGLADDHPGEAQPRNLGLALVESAVVLSVMTGYYWATIGSDSPDIDLEWDWESWEDKLTFDAVRFDTNEFKMNAVRHPAMAVVHYHIGRTNGLGMLGSTALAAANIVVWEYFIEYREYPSINDLIVNTVTGAEIGEPLWQIGQLWRGGVLTVGDRVKTTLFSPLDGLHDAVSRRHLRWTRPRAWRSIALGFGGVGRRLEDDRTRGEAVLDGDIDLVADRHYLAPGPQRCTIKPGTWSRIHGRLRLGATGDTGVVGTQLQSRTAIAGTYRQDGDANGLFVGLGTAFTYRRDRLADEWDHVAIPHIVGPQLQLSRRTPDLALRWDLAGYGDFAMIDAHVFGEGNPFPRPPPYVSALQAEGYYYGAGVSGATRLRVDAPAWSFDAELDAHKIWQLSGGDRIEADELPPTTTPYTAHGVSDLRLYWRAQLGVQSGKLGLAATAEGSHRRGTWRSLERSMSEVALGVLGRLDL